MRALIVLVGLIVAGCSAVPGLPGASATASPFIPITQSGWLSLELVAEGFTLPTAMTDLGDGRLLVAEQAGKIVTLEDGKILDEPFLDLSDRVLAKGERGLLGIAAHPDYATDPRLFVVYSDKDSDTQLVEFGPDGERSILTIPQESEQHKGGGLLFGPDGYLYLGVGDDHRKDIARADPEQIYGTILRLDVNAGDQPYAIPADNPFANGGGRPEIWSYGLRNPWRFAFDAEGGDLYIGDVGQDNVEEIDMQGATQAGVDFGWSQTEGDACRSKEACDFDTITTPIHDYDHKNGDCAVVGGPVISTAAGRQVVFGDLCSGRIWSIAAGGESPAELQIEGELRISSFGQDDDGTGYVLVHWKNGRIYRLVADAAG